jgi:hypothetical protein
VAQIDLRRAVNSSALSRCSRFRPSNTSLAPLGNEFKWNRPHSFNLIVSSQAGHSA